MCVGWCLQDVRRTTKAQFLEKLKTKVSTRGGGHQRDNGGYYHFTLGGNLWTLLAWASVKMLKGGRLTWSETKQNTLQVLVCVFGGWLRMLKVCTYNRFHICIHNAFSMLYGFYECSFFPPKLPSSTPYVLNLPMYFVALLCS
jgi:hypothetical protein